MSLGIPDDYDDAQPDKLDDDNTAMDSTDGQQPATDGPAAEDHRNLDEEIDELRKFLEANASVISEKASVTEVEGVHERLTALEQRLTDLEDNHQRLHRRLQKLEEYRRGRPEPSAEEVAAISPLSAAIFDDEPECPACGEGNLHVGGSFLRKQVVCSNDNCEFSRQVADL